VTFIIFIEYVAVNTTNVNLIKFEVYNKLSYYCLIYFCKKRDFHHVFPSC